jgi:recombination DNA repair RAD52 pathway protein
MAKGLRSSVKKNNRTKLRARVFAPVENERAERIHAKMLETLQAPKPEQPKKSEMDVDEGTQLQSSPATKPSAKPLFADSATTEKDSDLPKGSCFLTAKIPRSLTQDDDADSSCSSPAPSSLLAQEQESQDMRNFFFCLGLSSDVVGFNADGALKFAFDPLPQPWLSSDHGLTV